MELKKETLNELRDRLKSKNKFLPLLEHFIKNAIKESREQLTQTEDSWMFQEFYELFMSEYPKINVNKVFKHCQSPIEKIFINSLILLFLRKGLMGLHITEPFKDAELEIKNYRKAHKNIMSLTKQYIEMTGDEEMNDFEKFFQKHIDAGQYSYDDFHIFEYHRTIVENFTWDAYHLTLQAGFPQFKIDEKSARVDILIWSPGNENVNLIVECDGFQFHNTKEIFASDRRRDRLFQSKGYQVVRFSGTEIFNDPVGVSVELFEFIQNQYEPLLPQV
jgi:hypothetical protein